MIALIPPRGARAAPILATSAVGLLGPRAADFAPGVPATVGAICVLTTAILGALLLGISLRNGGL